MVLEHLIVQRLDQEESEDAPDDIASILEFGAKDIFQQAEAQADNERYLSSDDIVRRSFRMNEAHLILTRTRFWIAAKLRWPNLSMATSRSSKCYHMHES